MAYDVTFMPGDGVGPEVSEATRRVLEATGVKFNWDVQEAGIDVFKKEGTPLPDRVVDSLKRTKVGIKGPITTPVGTGFRSVNVTLRQTLDLYCCLRPCKTYPGVRTRFDNIDIVIFRENTEDLYAGIEFEKGSDGAKALIELVKTYTKKTISPTAGISIKPITVEGTDRIVRAAFQYARDNGRKKVTSVHKANIMKFSDGLWLEVSRQVAKDFPDIQFEDRIIDALCMQLVQFPERFDVLVLPNLYGDIVSDLCAGIVGGLGLAPGANIGTTGAIFEATHGSAPDIAGQNKVNPTAMLLSGAMMLNYLGEKEASQKMERAIAAVIAENKYVTADLKQDPDDPSAVGTTQMTDAIIMRMNG
ncbi:MAG TPA: isocitrate/isopropylmalate dehydrogenase family protein [Nitrospirota bacterium]